MLENAGTGFNKRIKLKIAKITKFAKLSMFKACYLSDYIIFRMPSTKL